MTYLLRFCNLNSPWMKKGTLIDVYEPSEYDYRLFIAKLDYVFVSFQLPYLCPSEGHKHGASIHSLIILIWLKHFFEYLPHKLSIAQTRIVARLFEYSSSLISFVFHFYWMVLMMVWLWKAAIVCPDICYSRNYKENTVERQFVFF